MVEDTRSEGDHLQEKMIYDKKIVGENDADAGNLSEHDDDEWTRVRYRRRKHIELRDLTEQDFIDLIEAKNQDKRFYGWLNFQPLFEDVDYKEPKERNKGSKQEMTGTAQEDDFDFFIDLFGLNIDDDEEEEKV